MPPSRNVAAAARPTPCPSVWPPSWGCACCSHPCLQPSCPIFCSCFHLTLVMGRLRRPWLCSHLLGPPRQSWLCSHFAASTHWEPSTGTPTVEPLIPPNILDHVALCYLSSGHLLMSPAGSALHRSPIHARGPPLSLVSHSLFFSSPRPTRCRVRCASSLPRPLTAAASPIVSPACRALDALHRATARSASPTLAFSLLPDPPPGRPTLVVAAGRPLGGSRLPP